MIDTIHESDRPSLSVAVSVVGDGVEIAQRYDQVRAALQALGETAEILFVTVETTDDTPELLNALQLADPRVKLLHLAQADATDGIRQAAVDFSSGERLVFLSGNSEWSANELFALLRSHDDAQPPRKLRGPVVALSAIRRSPLRAFAWLGLTTTAVSLVLTTLIVGNHIVFSTPPRALFTLATLIAFLSGVQVLFLSIAIECVLRVRERGRRSPRYTVARVESSHCVPSRVKIPEPRQDELLGPSVAADDLALGIPVKASVEQPTTAPTT